MRAGVEWTTASVIFVLLAGPAARCEDFSGTAAFEESLAHAERMEKFEAELAALRRDLDQLPTIRADTAFSTRRCARPCGSYAGFAFVFAKPHFVNGAAYRISELAPGLNNISVPYSYQRELTPRVWVGYVGSSGFGLRYRYWQFDHAGAPFFAEQETEGQWIHSFAEAGALGDRADWVGARMRTHNVGETLSGANALEVHTSDVELTQALSFRHLSATISGGLRYVRMALDYHALRTHISGAPLYTLDSHRVFRGLGPVVAVDVQRALGFWGLSVFANVRGSVAFGESNTQIDAYWPYVHRESDEVMSIGEGEIGLEMTRELSWGGSVFARFAYEAQLWQDAGTPNFPYGDLGFEGFSFALGFAR